MRYHQKSSPCRLLLVAQLCCFRNVASAAVRTGVRGLAKPVCGNNEKQGNEECDGYEFGGSTCISRGFAGGSLVCNTDCTIDDSGCWTAITSSTSTTTTSSTATSTSTAPSTAALEFFSETVIRETIPATLFGTNIVYSWERDDYWDSAVYNETASQSLFYTGSAFLRYPGGEVTSYFHWDNPVGRGWSDSWDNNFNGIYEPGAEWMGIDEYFNHLGNAKPLLGVNMASGWKYNRDQDGIAQAASLAALVKSQMDAGMWPDVEYFFLDNEQHLEKFTGTDTYYGSTQCCTPWTEALYAYYINLYAEEVKKIFPNAKFVANWKNNASPWSQLINSAAGSNIHVMDFHSYWHRNGWATTDWASYISGTNDVVRSPSGSTYREYVQSFKTVGGPNRETAMFEWGLSPSPAGSELSRYQSAFIVADIFMQLIDSDLDHSCYWPLRVPTGSEHSHRALLDDNNEPTVVRLFLQFFKEIKGYDLIETSIGAANMGTIAAKSKSGDKVVVYILRRTSGSIQIRISDSSTGFVPATANAVSWAAPNGDTITDFADWSEPVTHISPVGETTLTVPGWSLTRVVLDNICNNNGVCNQGEDSTNCPNDCPLCNNNGFCDPGEDTTNCFDDCCLATNLRCNHQGNCMADDCCSDCCSGNYGQNPKVCL